MSSWPPCVRASAEGSAEIRTRVLAARERQHTRFAGACLLQNSDLHAARSVAGVIFRRSGSRRGQRSHATRRDYDRVVIAEIFGVECLRRKVHTGRIRPGDHPDRRGQVLLLRGRNQTNVAAQRLYDLPHTVQQFQHRSAGVDEACVHTAGRRTRLN